MYKYKEIHISLKKEEEIKDLDCYNGNIIKI